MASAAASFFSVEDRFKPLFEKKLNIPVKNYSLYQKPDLEIDHARRFIYLGAEFIYRLPNAEDFHLVIYRQPKKVPGLAYAFAPMEQLILWLGAHYNDLRIIRLKGLAKPMDNSYRGLSLERLQSFYKKYAGALTLDIENNQEWLYVNVQTFRPVREQYRLRRAAQSI
ncbi:MAG: hypothetical protein B7X06_02790, partial [Verrucomicrobia bacterium 21-51-4]